MTEEFRNAAGHLSLKLYGYIYLWGLNKSYISYQYATFLAIY